MTAGRRPCGSPPTGRVLITRSDSRTALGGGGGCSSPAEPAVRGRRTMKNRWNRLCESRPGLTLIEVIAATALLGTLLTLLMLAHAGQLRQARQAELRLEAIE